MKDQDISPACFHSMTFRVARTFCHGVPLFDGRKMSERRNTWERINKTEGCDTSKILYEVSKIDRGKILRILRILEDSGDSLGIHGDS